MDHMFYFVNYIVFWMELWHFFILFATFLE